MNKVFVGSLSWNVNDQSLAEHFSRIGAITEAKVINDRETGRSRGFGFVTFQNANDAQEAVNQLDGTELDGRTIKVNIAQDKGDRDRGGSGGGNGGGRSQRPNRW